MRAWAIALALVGPTAGLSGQSAAGPHDLCVTGEQPKSVCQGGDLRAVTYWSLLGDAAVSRLRPDSDPEKPGGQVWYLVESSDVMAPELVTFNLVQVDPERDDSALTWQARRFRIALIDIAQLTDETYRPGAGPDFGVDFAALARRLPIVAEVADARDCPQIATAVDRLGPLLRVRLILPPKAKGSHMYDGVSISVGARGELAGTGSTVSLALSGNVDMPTTRWALDTEKALANCWRLAPSAE